MSTESEPATKKLRSDTCNRSFDDSGWQNENPFEKGNTFDEVELQFDNGQSLFVSKGFLMYTSPVFDRMLKSEFREKHTNAIKMVGKDFGQVQDLMLHLHPGRRKSITADNASNIFRLANEYQMPAVQEVCENVLNEAVKELRLFKHWNELKQENFDKAMEILLIADTFNLKKVISSACENITRLPVTHYIKHPIYRQLSQKVQNTVLVIRAVRSDNGKYHGY